MPNKIDVEIEEKHKSYPIYMDTEPIEDLKERIIKDFDLKNYLVVISEKVYKLYGKILGFDSNEIFILKDGEIQKNFKNYQKIIQCCEKKGLNRKSALIAIGGGVVGDITGFAASTYMRGIKFIQVPTTLLACVDSSVGGKVAIDTDYGKNLVGAFYQPHAVYINLQFLNTLDEIQYKSGLAEVVKYAFIEKSCGARFDFGLFDFLSVHSSKILDKDLRFVEKVIKVCIELKIAVVSKDEKEAGLRKILNFGHTYGHALEKISNYKTFTHGEAVAYGMHYIFNYAHKLKMIDANYKEMAVTLLHKFGFYNKTFKYPTDKIINIMKNDKKAEDNVIKVILPMMKGYVKEGDLDIQAALNCD
ncbi:3-dehydroquinate synthase [bacterium]|nr:3-dehydroquinate synthase [bacterium]